MNLANAVWHRRGAVCWSVYPRVDVADSGRCGPRVEAKIEHRSLEIDFAEERGHATPQDRGQSKSNSHQPTQNNDPTGLQTCLNKLSKIEKFPATENGKSRSLPGRASIFWRPEAGDPPSGRLGAGVKPSDVDVRVRERRIDVHGRRTPSAAGKRRAALGNMSRGTTTAEHFD